jgi:hypothetical protein
MVEAAAEEEGACQGAGQGAAHGAMIAHATGDAGSHPSQHGADGTGASLPAGIGSSPGGICSSSPGPGLSRVLSYMSSIQPREPSGGGAVPSAATREHLTDAPTLLPHVIFQDLVFGHELGVGAFSTVRGGIGGCHPYRMEVFGHELGVGAFSTVSGKGMGDWGVERIAGSAAKPLFP